MQNDASSPASSTPIISLESYRAARPKRRYQRRGSAFFRQSLASWIVTFNPGVIRARLDDLQPARHRGPEYTISRPERRLLEALLAHGMSRRVELIEPATGLWLADKAGMCPGNANRILRRFGTCWIVVNLGGCRSLDLAINGDLMAWDLSQLRKLRNERSRKVSGQTRPNRL